MNRTQKGMTLIGFVRGDGMVAYTDNSRLS